MRSSRRQYMKRPVIFASIVATIVFILIGLVFNFGIRLTIFSTQIAKQSCQYSEQSLCELETHLKNYMALQDISDILEQQQVMRITCDQSHASESYCAGNSDLPVALFRVDDTAAGTQLLSRNDYITFFNKYLSTHGPFSYASDSGDATHVTMKFASKDNRAIYDLQLLKIVSRWLFIAPKIGQN